MSVYIYKKKIIHLSVTLTDLNQRSQLFSRGMQIKTDMWTHWLKDKFQFYVELVFSINKFWILHWTHLLKRRVQILHWTRLLNRWIEKKNSYFTLNSSFQHMLSTWNPIQIVLVLEVFWGQQRFNKYFKKICTFVETEGNGGNLFRNEK